MLDAPDALAAADPAGMLRAVESWPEQWRDAVARTRSIPAGALPEAEALDHVVVCGMGGSAVAGDVLRAVAAPALRVPVVVVRSHELPAFVGPASLVFCVSYSGDTEETIACFEEARARGARLIAVAGGGALGRRAAAAAIPCVEPAPGLQPRAALASLAPPLLVMLDRVGLLPGIGEDLAAAAALTAESVRACRGDVPTARNEAKRLAVSLHGLFPTVWGAEGALSVAATRWKTQLNENAKLPATASALPELGHNEVVGFDPGHPALAQTVVVALRARAEDPRIEARFRATLDLVSPRVAKVEEVVVDGRSALEQTCAAVVLGDFVSVYLAVLRGVDPTPVEAIRRLKEATEQRPAAYDGPASAG